MAYYTEYSESLQGNDEGFRIIVNLDLSLTFSHIVFRNSFFFHSSKTFMRSGEVYFYDSEPPFNFSKIMKNTIIGLIIYSLWFLAIKMTKTRKFDKSRVSFFSISPGICDIFERILILVVVNTTLHDSPRFWFIKSHY